MGKDRSLKTTLSALVVDRLNNYGYVIWCKACNFFWNKYTNLFSWYPRNTSVLSPLSSHSSLLSLPRRKQQLFNKQSIFSCDVSLFSDEYKQIKYYVPFDFSLWFLVLKWRNCNKDITTNTAESLVQIWYFEFVKYIKN